MLRCKSEPITLGPIKAVSEHLSERIILEANEESIPYYVNGFRPPAPSFAARVSRAKSEQDTLETKPSTDPPAMNNNLMFRSMFFMNDEPRHFLAPHIPPLTNDPDYFQRKPQGAVNGGAQATVSSQTTGQGPVESPGSSKQMPPKQRPHTCEECGKSFLLKHHLATHVRVHTGERPHVCPECGKTFALKHCLSTHLLLHSAERPYKCNECNKSFTLKHHLVSHEKMHTRDRPFECRECGQTFAQKRHLSTHLKFHSGERPFSCQVCGETFTREEHLVMHSRFHGGLQPYICPDCGAGFLRKFQLVDHERQHGRCPDTCPTCGKEFLQKRTLLLHVRTCGLNNVHHSHINDTNEPQPKVCKECGQVFSSSEGLALHMRLHIGDHSFLSDICSLAASLKQAAGAPTPTLKKIHSCPDCNRTFTQKHGLNQHMQRYPNGACKLKPFTCEKCGKSFSQKNHLVLHERQHMEPEQRSELKHRAMQMEAMNSGQQQGASLNDPKHRAPLQMDAMSGPQASLLRHLEMSGGQRGPGERPPHMEGGGGAEGRGGPMDGRPATLIDQEQRGEMKGQQQPPPQHRQIQMEQMDNSQALLRHLELSTGPQRTHTLTLNPQ